MTSNQLLIDWLRQDSAILKIEYNNHMEKKTKKHTNKENVKTLAETNMGIEENVWTKIKCKGWNRDEIAKENKWKVATNKGLNKKEKQIKKNVKEKEENYYKTLSENVDKLDYKFDKMEVVEEESDEEMKVEKEFITYTIKKERHKYKNKTPKGKDKSEMKK